MDIIDIKQDSTLFDKYAPKKISEIIGCRKQKGALIDWLKKYEENAELNLIAQKNKKNGKKTRKRRVKEVQVEIDSDSDREKDIEDLDLDEEELELLDNKKKKKDPNMCACAIITGDHGTGKTSVVKAILTSLGYQIKSVNFTKIGVIKSVDDFIDNLLISAVDDFIDDFLTSDDVIHSNKNKQKNKKYAVLVDEVHSVITPTEKNIILGLFRINSELWGCPVIFIGSNKHNKIMTAIKKDCYHISMYPPDAEDMLNLLERVGLGEGMVLENENVAIEIIKNAQNDYRRLIVVLGELHRIHGSNVITEEDISRYSKFAGEKDVDRSIFENTVRLFSKYEGLNTSLKIFGLDKTNMPLMVHQNHFLATNSYIKDSLKNIDVSYNIAENLAKGDVVENFIYSDQNWPLQETYGFYACVYPSYTLSNTINTDKLMHDAKNPYWRPKFATQYPKDLNRTSTRCINYKKNIKPANAFFKDMTIDDYVMAVKLIKNMLEDSRVTECEEILKTYGLTSQGIMYVLKMDKINGTRKDVPKTIENKVKRVAVDPIKMSVIRKH